MNCDIVVDAVGLLCPLPVLKLRKALGALRDGQIACLHSSDPAAVIDVAHFCAEQGHILVTKHSESNVHVFYVQKHA